MDLNTWLAPTLVGGAAVGLVLGCALVAGLVRTRHQTASVLARFWSRVFSQIVPLS